MTVGPIWFGGIAALLFLGGALAATQEFGSALGSDPHPVARATLIDGMHPGLSPQRQYTSLSQCYEFVGSPYVMTRPTGERKRVLEECGRLSSEVTSLAPAGAFGWLVRAQIAADLDDSQGFNRFMIRSYITGPREGWVAAMRVEQAERNFDQLGADALGRHRQDLSLLVLSSFGVRSIAKRYLANPSFQERIVAIVETLPEADQRRFLQMVRGLAYSR